MRSPGKYILILVLLLLPHGAHSAFSSKEDGPSEDDQGLCGVARRGLQETIEKAQVELGKGLPTKALLNNCATAYREYYDSCTTPQELERFGCKATPPADKASSGSSAPAPKGGIAESADKLAAGLIKDSNCKRRVSQCVSQGGLIKSTHGKDSQAFERCLNGDKASFSPIKDPKTPRDRDASARNVLLHRIYLSGLTYTECLRKRADAEEALARKTLEDAAVARADGDRRAVNCIDKGEGLQECEVAKGAQRFTPADGQREDFAPRDPEAGRDNPALVRGADNHCSGTLLGDERTVVTAGHCLDSSGRGERQITVRDSQGQEHTVTAQCSGTFDGVGYSDLARCTLSQPIKANPVYFATHDPSVPGSACIDDGYVKRCGSGFFQDLTNKPVTVWGYPGDQGLNRSVGTFTGTGTSGWFWRNGVLYHDLICTGGCSGSGYMVDVGGQRVVVGAHSFGYVYGFNGGGSIPTYRQWEGLRIQSVTTRKLADASLLFQQLQ